MSEWVKEGGREGGSVCVCVNESLRIILRNLPYTSLI